MVLNWCGMHLSIYVSTTVCWYVIIQSQKFHDADSHHFYVLTLHGAHAKHSLPLDKTQISTPSSN